MASSSSTSGGHGPSSAVRALALELKSLQDDPLEGIRSKLVNDENMFEWEVALFGPPETLYEGGYFKVSRSQVPIPNLSSMTSLLQLNMLHYNRWFCQFKEYVSSKNGSLGNSIHFGLVMQSAVTGSKRADEGY